MRQPAHLVVPGDIVGEVGEVFGVEDDIFTGTITMVDENGDSHYFAPNDEVELIYAISEV